ncbi:MAG TPA: cation:proton antiporter, partial [Bacteroidia bacterium]|nr:cation:proton antiporter [Bacteroidia bacterium]
MKFTHTDLITLLSSVAIMLIVSRLLAEMGRKVKLPVVMGELICGIVLGPTVFGHFYPDLFSHVFPKSGGAQIALDGLTQLSVIMLLFVAGMEVQLSILLKQGRAATYTSFASMIIPFVLGFGIVWFFPSVFQFDAHNKLVYALFFGIAMSISALPVISRILMDLNIYKTDVGMMVMAAAIFVDLTGWLLFSLVLSMMGQSGQITNIWQTLGMILGFGLFMLVIGKKIIDRALPWIQTKLSWPGGVLSICLGFCFLGATFTEYIGLHAILGAFIMGIAFGDSVHLHEKAREIIHQFVMNVFAPLFFVSLGLKVNFVENFDPLLVLIVLFLAVFCKLFGASLGAYMGGFSKRKSIAVGFGL